MIELTIEPGRVLTREQFIAESTQREVGSIALDGYVIGPKFFEVVDNPFGESVGVQNFNHHEGVDRLATLATCGQVDIALKSGFVEAFRNELGRFEAEVLVNDSDQDVCASVWLLRHAHRIHGQGQPNINRFVQVASAMDMTAGSYPYHTDEPFMEVMNWINLPYAQARLSGEATSGDPATLRRIIDDVCHRIDKYVMGSAEQVPLDTRFDRLDKGNGWEVIREVGTQGRLGAMAEGANALVIVRDQVPGQLQISLWRRSEWITGFDVPRILAALNKAEQGMSAEYSWGGADTVGGSPRVGGTKLSLDKVLQIVRAETEEGASPTVVDKL